MAKTIVWVGGRFTRGAGGTAPSDGDFIDTNNWMLEDGTMPGGVPAVGDTLIFNSRAAIVPANYVNANYPHEVGKRWSVCVNMDASALTDLVDVTITEGYDGNIFGYLAQAFDAGASGDDGGLLQITCTANPFTAGGWAILTGTTYHNGEFRITADALNTITVDKPATPAETFAATAYIVERTPLRFTCSGQVTVKGTGIIYLECSDVATYDNIPKLVFDSVSGILHIGSDQWRGAYLGTWNDILVMGGGTLKIGKDTIVSTIAVTADSTITLLAGLGLTDDGTNPTDFTFAAGTIAWDSELGTGTISGGKITFCNNPLCDGIQSDIESITIYNGTLDWYGLSAMLGYEQWGGVITAKGAQDKIFGTGATQYQHYGGSLDFSEAEGLVAQGGTSTLKHWGGDWSPANGMVLEWT